MAKWLKVEDKNPEYAGLAEYINLDEATSIQRSGNATTQRLVIYHGNRFTSVTLDKADKANPAQSVAATLIAKVDAYLKTVV